MKSLRLLMFPGDYARITLGSFFVNLLSVLI